MDKYVFRDDEMDGINVGASTSSKKRAIETDDYEPSTKAKRTYKEDPNDEIKANRQVVKRKSGMARDDSKKPAAKSAQVKSIKKNVFELEDYTAGELAIRMRLQNPHFPKEDDVSFIKNGLHLLLQILKCQIVYGQMEWIDRSFTQGFILNKMPSRSSMAFERLRNIVKIQANIEQFLRKIPESRELVQCTNVFSDLPGFDDMSLRKTFNIFRIFLTTTGTLYLKRNNETEEYVLIFKRDLSLGRQVD